MNSRLRRSLSAIPLIFLSLAVIFAWYLQPLEGNRRGGRLSTNSDIFATWQESHRICSGQNPYARTVKENSARGRTRKPPAYLPGFYVIGCGIEKLGFDTYRSWLSAWSTVLITLHISIALLFYAIWTRHGLPFVGSVIAALWLVGFHSRHTLFNYQTNTLAILPLLLSLLAFETRRTTSFLLLGASLAIKQIAVFLVPLYLCWTWNERRSAQAVLKSLMLIGAIPALFSAPFVVADPFAFFLSLGTQLTRAGALDRNVPSLAALFGSGLAAKAILVGMVCAVCALAIRYKNLPRSAAAALVMLSFVSLNTVVFPQYLLWIVALMPIAALETVLFAQVKKSPASGTRTDRGLKVHESATYPESCSLAFKASSATHKM